MRCIMRVICRQTGIPNVSRYAKPAKYLHRARGNMVALHVRRLAAVTRLYNCDRDSARREIERQRNTDWSRAHHQDVAISSRCLHQRTRLLHCPIARIEPGTYTVTVTYRLSRGVSLANTTRDKAYQSDLSRFSQ